MKRLRSLPVLLAVTAILAAIGGTYLVRQPAALAATPVTAALPAKAGSGGVTKGLFVKLSAAGTIAASSAVTDKVVGVCELTADANAMTRYAPAGTQTTVTSGEAIAVGDLLTSGTGGKAFVLDASDSSTQRVAALALTAASGADEDVTCIVLASNAETNVPVNGATTCAGATLAIPITHAYVAKTTGGAEALTLANGVPGQVITITLVSDGGDGTLTPATCSGFATIVFADAGDVATLMFVDATTGWIILGTAGTAAPPVITAPA